MTDYETYWRPGGFGDQARHSGAHPSRWLYSQLHTWGRPGIRVADLGCGNGHPVGTRLAAGGAKYVGVDVSRSAIDAARAAGLDVMEIGDLSCTRLPGDSFDVVFVIEVLEHLIDPLGALREAHRILHPGGSLVAQVPNAAVLSRRVELAILGRTNMMGDVLSRTEPWRDPHLRAFTVSSLGALVSRAGFQGAELGGTEALTDRRLGPVALANTAERLARWRPTLFARRCTVLARKGW